MALIVQRIELERFRSWDSFAIEPSEGLTVIVGPNAAGKTNVIEAIQLLTTGRSFRNPKWADLVAEGEQSARIAIRAAGDGRVRDVTMGFAAQGARTITVNGTKKRGVSSILGALPSVMFTPDDLRLVKDSAQRRRDEIDGLGEQLSATYRDITAQYDRGLRQRNTLLKQDDLDESVFDAWTERLADLGSALALHRVKLFGRLAPKITDAYEQVARGERLEVHYVCPWWEPDSAASRETVRERLIEQLAARRDEERARRVTLVGPHRDDIAFSVDGRDARTYASQGQQRTIALAWKMAEVSAVEEITGSRPILLLDDVMSELDGTRREALSQTVVGSAQTIVTTTNLGYFEAEVLEGAKVVDLRGA